MSGNVSGGIEASALNRRAAVAMKVRQLSEERAADKRPTATVHQFSLRPPIDLNLAPRIADGAA